jgi:hypothetical protein
MKPEIARQFAPLHYDHTEGEVRTGKGLIVAFMTARSGEELTSAYGNLFAAAPGLYAALRKFVERCDQTGLTDRNISFLAEARAALAQVEGR